MRACAGDLAAALLTVVAVLSLSGLLRSTAENSPPPGRVAIGPLADPQVIAIEAIYASYAREARDGGGVRVHQHQDSREHAAVLVRPLEWALGRLARARGWSARETYDAARRLSVPLVALGLGALLVALVRDRGVRRSALFVGLLGGNLYWVVELAGRDSLSGARTWIQSTHSAISGLGYGFGPVLASAPHLALEIGFLALAFAASLAAARARSAVGTVVGACGAGFAVLLLACVRPYTVPVALVAAAFALWSGVRRGSPARRTAALVAPIVVAAPCAPYLWHVYRVLRGGTVFSGLDVAHSAPPPHEIFLFLGAPAIGAALLLLPSVRRGRRTGGALDGPARGLLGGWALANLALVFGEPLVRWEVEALQPLPILALVLAALAVEGLVGRARILVGAALVAGTLAGGGAWWLETARALEDPRSSLWIGSDEAAVLEQLEELRGPAGLAADRAVPALACSPDLGRLVPYLAGCRVYAGHPDHTPSHAARERSLARLLATGQGLETLIRGGVTHLLFGERERALGERALRQAGVPPGGPWDPAVDPRLTEVVRRGTVVLYAIHPAR